MKKPKRPIAEQALAKHPGILNPIVHGLVCLLDTEDTPLKGDTADLLGQIEHPHAREPLKMLLQDANRDIVETAEEALKSISPPAKP